MSRIKVSQEVFDLQSFVTHTTLDMERFYQHMYQAHSIHFNVKLFPAYADEARINPSPLTATPWLLQIEWTAKSETPITIFRVQFMVRERNDY